MLNRLLAIAALALGLGLASPACAQTTIPAGAYTDLGAGPAQLVNLANVGVSLCVAASQPAPSQICQGLAPGAAPTPFATSLHLWAMPLQNFPASVYVSPIAGGSSGPSTVTSNDGGAAITGATMPSGGSGLTGWLSAIWSRLSGAAQETGGNLAALATANGAQADAAYSGTGAGSHTALLKWIGGKLAGVLSVTDSQNAGYQGAVAMTVGTSYAAQRSVLANCTATGNVSLTMGDGSTGIWIIAAAGSSIIPFAATAIQSSGTTATCTYANLK